MIPMRKQTRQLAAITKCWVKQPRKRHREPGGKMMLFTKYEIRMADESLYGPRIEQVMEKIEAFKRKAN